ncbi:hypothetical protein [Brevundimonas naejangsanensis]|uniref:hypothetical protein n=1 Tax=Brevundimonas naejangsanensis TaxID=588932 RepID=UPI0026E9FFB3|nr:hypothetical protein [Brevundimonas naejangsanensis]
MDDAFVAATRFKIAALETVVGDLITVLHGLAPEEIEALQIATEQRMASADDDVSRRLHELRLQLLDDGVSRSTALQGR